MALPAAADPPRANQQPSTSPSTPQAPPATKNLLTREFDLTLRAFFPTPTAPVKFQPIGAMTQLLRTMLKDESSLVLRTPSNDQQLVLASDRLPTGEKAFKQFFKVSTTRNDNKNQTHVCIGCHVLSDRSLGNIKFRSKDNHLLAWIKKANIFIEADSLGTDRPVTIGYFTKIDPVLTNLTNFRDELHSELSMIDIDAATAVLLAPHLKQAQLEAMTNGDEFVPILPHFEVYRTSITHGRALMTVTTDVLGVKSAPKDTKLLVEFLARLASENSNNQRDGIFLPKGAATLLGPTTYEQVMQKNNFFLTTIATIPVNLEYGAWFAVINTNPTSENEPVSLYDHLIRKPWFLRIESVARNKCLIVTTKSNLPETREWIDENLEKLIRTSIPPGINPPTLLLPRRLDKPVYSTMCHSYADILKKQFSLISTSTTSATHNNQPPRKQQATIIDYDLDQSTDYPPSLQKFQPMQQATILNPRYSNRWRPRPM